MRFRFIFSFFCIFLLNPHVFSQEIIIQGKVFDQTSNEELGSASIYDRITARAVITDESGFYELRVPAGEHEIQVSYMGYEKIESRLYITSDTIIDFYLTILPIPVDEISIMGNRKRDFIGSTEMGSFILNKSEMDIMPSLLGEVDAFKLLQLTPGIQTSLSGGVGFFVRGGGVDQNLVLLDNTLIYNPGHLLGIFSAFNSDLIKDVSIYKSGIPARFGGKLSSVISLSSFSGEKDSLITSGSIGMIFSKISLSGPLPKNKGSFIIGGRRTYINLIVKPIIKRSAGGETFLNQENIYNFYDLNAVISFNVSDKDKLRFTGYYGRDNYNNFNERVDRNNSFNWGNSMMNVSWDHIFNQDVFMNSKLSWTNYGFNLSGSQEEYHFGLSSGVNDFNFKSELFIEKGRTEFSAGIEITEHQFSPNALVARYGNFDVDFFKFEKLNSLEGGLFFDHEYSFSENFSLSGGLRLSFFNQHGPYREILRNSLGHAEDTIYHALQKSLAFYMRPEPRLAIKYKFSDDASVKASYMRIAQYVHLASSASATLPLDIWIPSSSEIKPMTGDQVSLGYFRKFHEPDFEFSSEVYFKNMKNKLEFIRGILVSSFDGSINDNIVSGYGRSYGIEFYLGRTAGKTTGWMSYTLSRSENRFDEINLGSFYPAKYDRTHDFSITLARKFNDRWSASSTFVYLSGNAYTMPVGRYLIQGEFVNQYGDVNAFRMPAYHRLDLSFTRKFMVRGKYNSELVFSVYNVYNRLNPLFIYYEIVGDVEGYSVEIMAFKVYLLPVIPSVSWNFKF